MVDFLQGYFSDGHSTLVDADLEQMGLVGSDVVANGPPDTTDTPDTTDMTAEVNHVVAIVNAVNQFHDWLGLEPDQFQNWLLEQGLEGLVNSVNVFNGVNVKIESPEEKDDVKLEFEEDGGEPQDGESLGMENELEDGESAGMENEQQMLDDDPVAQLENELAAEVSTRRGIPPEKLKQAALRKIAQCIVVAKGVNGVKFAQEKNKGCIAGFDSITVEPKYCTDLLGAWERMVKDDTYEIWWKGSGKTSSDQIRNRSKMVYEALRNIGMSPGRGCRGPKLDDPGPRQCLLFHTSYVYKDDKMLENLERTNKRARTE